MKNMDMSVEAISSDTLNGNMTDSGFIDTIPKMVNLIFRPVWIILGTLGKICSNMSKGAIYV